MADVALFGSAAPIMTGDARVHRNGFLPDDRLALRNRAVAAFAFQAGLPGMNLVSGADPLLRSHDSFHNL
jgi:hypothetical protein